MGIIEEINGMTPEQIKEHLRAFVQNWYNPSLEVWKNGHYALVAVMTYIEQLEEQISLMKIQMQGDCGCCKHRRTLNAKYDVVKGEFVLPDLCKECLTSKDGRKHWEYEGLPEVKSK